MALAYTAPTWSDGSGVGISASQLQALCDCMEGLVQGSDKAITNIAISGQTITLTFADGSEETGTASGLKGISSIAKTGTSGLVDTYTITYTDGSTSTFTVTNGADSSFYIVTAGIKSTDDPYGNIEYYIGGDFYKNGVLYNQSAYFKVTLVNESDYPPTPYLVDGSSGTFTNGHYSTGSIGAIPSGATITTQIFTDSTMTTLLGMVKVIIGLQGSEGEQGPQGPAGDDGVSPEVTITTITGGHRVNITDATHPQGQNFDVMDGANTVVPNPQGTSVGDLTSIGINGDKYDIQGGGGASALADLTDVNISNPTDGQILQYDAASQKWVNESGTVIPSKTVTVYSAASDTLTYSDLSGTKTVTTDANGEGTANIVCVDGASITFTSSVAKNPSDLSNAYSKTVTVNSSTTAVYVMPDNVCYWWGYKSSEYEVVSENNGWNKSSGKFDAPTENTNYILCDAVGNLQGAEFSAIAFKTARTGTTFKAIKEGVRGAGSPTTYGFDFASSDKILTSATIWSNTSAAITLESHDISTLGTKYFACGSSNTRALKVYAFWLE